MGFKWTRNWILQKKKIKILAEKKPFLIFLSKFPGKKAWFLTKFSTIFDNAEKRAKSQNSAGKFSKTGRFQTAGAAQPIELSKKRRHF